MRYDMSFVVIERPRSGSRYDYHDVRVRHKGIDIEKLEDLPKNEGYRAAHRVDRKQSTDLLGPLEGFLRSRVGQKWDDVYSEIRERLNPSSTVHIHIMNHLFQFIYDKTSLGDDGHIWAHRSSIRYNGGPFRVGFGDLYVHPTTGLICAMPKRKRYYVPGYDAAIRKLRGVFGNDWLSVCGGRYSHRVDIIAESKKHIRIGFEKELHKVNGVWYWAEFSDVPPPFTRFWFDEVSRQMKSRIVTSGIADHWTGVVIAEGRYRSGKHQACRRDLRRYRVKNDS